ITIASSLNLPIIDADGMGRAFPELQMVTFHLNGVNASPVSLIDEKGKAMIVDAKDGKTTENIARAATSALGCSLFVGIYPMTGREVKDYSIANSLTYEEEIGDIILHSKNPIADLLDITNGYVLFSGKIMDVERKTAGGFVRGQVKLEGLDS